MRRARRTFSAEFKAEVLKLIIEREYPIPQVCRELDVSEMVFRYCCLKSITLNNNEFQILKKTRTS